MESLKRAFRWDEERFGLEYDLDTFMIFCADDFNMGAMENKGLNIFNSRLVLADPDTATDDDYGAIEAVIGHEYFHNWTGNRVTCRDWFQLSLKEGLTVFRDQEFSSDLNSRAVERIAAVEFLRREQFPEDAGPMAHNVRPDEYLEINNFYTSTVYEKGAEVIRMQHTLLGADRFRKGMDLYFKRHDGQAVTCDDFAQAMEDASRVDLGQFRRWYSQAGTPVVDVRGTLRCGDADVHAGCRAKHARHARAGREGCRFTFRSRSGSSARTAATFRSSSKATRHRSAPRACSTCARHASSSASPTSRTPGAVAAARLLGARDGAFRLFGRRTSRSSPRTTAIRSIAGMRRRRASARRSSPWRATCEPDARWRSPPRCVARRAHAARRPRKRPGADRAGADAARPGLHRRAGNHDRRRRHRRRHATSSSRRWPASCARDFERVYGERRVRASYAPTPAQIGARKLANTCLRYLGAWTMRPRMRWRSPSTTPPTT